jgi:uncharacterized membrane protein
MAGIKSEEGEKIIKKGIEDLNKKYAFSGKRTYIVPWRIASKNILSSLGFLLIVSAILIYAIAVIIKSQIISGLEEQLSILLLIIITSSFLIFNPIILPFLGRTFKYSNPDLTSWIMENVHCPECGGGITSCTCSYDYHHPKYFLPTWWWSPPVWLFCVAQCKDCNKKFTYVIAPPHPVLSLLGEFDEFDQNWVSKIDKEYISTFKRGVICFVLAAILFLLLMFLFLYLLIQK